jgi:lipoprotein signal peptidase
MFGQKAVSSEAWSERLLALLLIAVVLAAIDQTVKHTFPTPLWAVHHRSGLWFVGSCVVLVAVLPLTRLPSRGVAIAAGVFAGGVLGNLLSAAADGRNVPNPIIIMHGVGGLAFNPADAFIEAGNLALMAMLVSISLRHRDSLAGWRANGVTALRRLLSPDDR